MQLQVKFNTWLVGKGVKAAEPTVVAPDKRPAQHFEVKVCGTR
jgi:hypothetical protein